MNCLILLILMVNLVLAKQYQRCELAKELYEKHNIKFENVGMLVCFAEYFSGLQTGKYGNGVYGLFQLNGDYWCSKGDDTANGCDMKCSDLLDDDITDDVKCVKKIILLEGLNAWGISLRCASTSNEIIKQCFPYSDSSETPHVIVKDAPEDYMDLLFDSKYEYL